MAGNTRKKTSRKLKLRKKLLFDFVAIAVIVTMTFTMGKYFSEIIGKYKEKKILDVKLEELQKKEKQLQHNADMLQDPEYIARYAREKYLYSKDGEYIIKIPEKE